MASSCIIHPLRCGTIHPPLTKGSLRRTELPVWCYLVEHPHGLMLIDTGLGPNKLPLPMQNYYRPEITEEQTVFCRLKEKGISPGDIDLLMLSSLNPDCTGGFRAVAGAKRVMLSEEEYFWTPRTVFALRQPRSLWEGEKIERFFFKGTPIGPQKHSLDLFGDESLVFVLTPGPTFGMTSIILRSREKKAVFCSALVRSPAEMDEGYVYHKHYQNLSINWLRDEISSPDCAAVLSTHDRKMSEKTIEF